MHVDCVSLQQCTAVQVIDEVQAYILLRRWQSDHKDQLAAERQQGVLHAYFEERLYILESIKILLQLSEGTHRLPDTFCQMSDHI